MRKLSLLAALALGGATVPAEAAVVQYGIAFDQTNVSFDSREGDPSSFYRPRGGTFSFDTEANQLLSFNVDAATPTSTLQPSRNDQAIALFAAAGPCDLACFIGAVNGGVWSVSGGSSIERTTITFGSPLNGSVSNINPGPQRFFSLSGVTRVTGPVPEPGTWLMMLLGFGAIGYSLRSSRGVKARLATA